jgi:predicted esterase
MKRPHLDLTIEGKASAAVIACLFLLIAGCGPSVTSAVKIRPRAAIPGQLPERVLELDKPADFSAVLDGTNLSKEDGAVLNKLAFSYGSRGAYRQAAQCQWWAVNTSNEGRYDMACFECLGGNVDRALYWLQEAARLESVSSTWASNDTDLKRIRDNSCWPDMLLYLQDCEAYWRAAVPKVTIVIAPKDYDGSADLQLVVWLHGMGSNPGDLKTGLQSLADRHHIAFVCVSGTNPSGKQKFSWADVAKDDFERVSLALSEARKQVHIRDDDTIAMGFSQGGLTAIEIAVRHPETFAGVISISAGAGSPLQIDEVTERGSLKTQGFVIVCGAKENPTSVQRSAYLEKWLKASNANVLTPPYPEHATHSFPPDFGERFPEWVAFINGARGVRTTP